MSQASDHDRHSPRGAYTDASHAPFHKTTTVSQAPLAWQDDHLHRQQRDDLRRRGPLRPLEHRSEWSLPDACPPNGVRRPGRVIVSTRKRARRCVRDIARLDSAVASSRLCRTPRLSRLRSGIGAEQRPRVPSWPAGRCGGRGLSTKELGIGRGDGGGAGQCHPCIGSDVGAEACRALRCQGTRGASGRRRARWSGDDAEVPL